MYLIPPLSFWEWPPVGLSVSFVLRPGVQASSACPPVSHSCFFPSAPSVKACRTIEEEKRETRRCSGSHNIIPANGLFLFLAQNPQTRLFAKRDSRSHLVRQEELCTHTHTCHDTVSNVAELLWHCCCATLALLFWLKRVQPNV